MIRNPASLSWATFLESVRELKCKTVLLKETGPKQKTTISSLEEQVDNLTISVKLYKLI